MESVRLKLLVDSGSSVCGISQDIVDKIKSNSQTQLTYLKNKVSSLYGVSGTKLDTNGIVMLNILFTCSDTLIKRVPFVILGEGIHNKVILGCNTILTRKLILEPDNNGFIIRRQGKPPELFQCNMMELKEPKQFIKAYYDTHEPIDLISCESLTLHTGDMVQIKCQVGESLKNNLNKLVFKIEDPFINYIGLANSMKKGKIMVVINNPGPHLEIEPGFPIGKVIPISDQDIEVYPLPQINELSERVSNLKVHSIKCTCKLEGYANGTFVSFGYDNQSIFFTKDFDILIPDPDWIKKNSNLTYEPNNLKNIKGPLYFCVREFYTISLKQMTVLMDLTRTIPNLEILCVTNPCVQHAKIIVSQLVIYLSSWLHFETEFRFKFHELPLNYFESDTDLSSNHNSIFPKVKLLIHTPMIHLRQKSHIETLKTLINKHFLTKSTIYIFQTEITELNTQHLLTTEGFIKIDKLGGKTPTYKCELCSACLSLNGTKIDNEIVIPDTPIPITIDSIDLISTNLKEKFKQINPQYKSSFHSKSLVRELQLMDLLEKPIKSKIHQFMESISNDETESLITEEKILENTHDMELGTFENNEQPKTWIEQANLDGIDPEDLSWVISLCTEFQSIFQTHSNQRGSLKYDYDFKVELDDENVKPFKVNQYPCSPIFSQFLERAIKSMCDNKMIQPTDMDPSRLILSPILITMRNSKINFTIRKLGGDKKAVGDAINSLDLSKMRVLLDCRKLNTLITDYRKSNVYIKDYLENFSSFKFASSLDFAKGFPSLRLHPESQNKVCFKHRSQVYKFLVPPSGLKTIPSWFGECIAFCLKKSLTHHVRNDPNRDYYKFYGPHNFGKDDIPPLPPNLVKKADVTNESNNVEQGESSNPTSPYDSETFGAHPTKFTGSKSKDILIPNKDNPNYPQLFGHSHTMDELVIAYVDDVFILSRNPDIDLARESHKKLLRSCFEEIRESGLILSPKKCIYAQQKSIQALGFDLSANGYKPISDRYRIFDGIKVPETKSELFKYLGMVSYLRGYIEGTSLKLAPLYGLLSKTSGLRSKLNYSPEELEAFHRINDDMKNIQSLHFFNPGKDLICSLDASAYGIGGSLNQLDENNKRHTILFFSKKFSNDLIKSLTSFEKEVLSLVQFTSLPGVDYYISQCFGTLYIENDSSSVIAMLAHGDSKHPKMLRWIARLSTIGIPVRFKHKSNASGAIGPDVLSRLRPNPTRRIKDTD